MLEQRILASLIVFQATGNMLLYGFFINNCRQAIFFRLAIIRGFGAKGCLDAIIFFSVANTGNPWVIRPVLQV